MKQEKNRCADNAAAGQAAKDEEFMRKALAEAEAARDAGEIPVGAVSTDRADRRDVCQRS